VTEKTALICLFAFAVTLGGVVYIGLWAAGATDDQIAVALLLAVIVVSSIGGFIPEWFGPRRR
jgi:hypothetical protein